jgi:RimJ/RimL family protein N-acetyltransferase
MPCFSTSVLATARLKLRWLDEDDAAAQFAIFSDPEVMRFIDAPWTRMDQAEDAVKEALAYRRDGTGVVFGIELPDTGEIVGNVNLHRFFERNRRCETGYAIASAHQGKGYATEALTALIEYGLRELDINRFEADINPANTASRRVLDRLGFRLEGLMPERWVTCGKTEDTAFYGLLKRYWEER